MLQHLQHVDDEPAPVHEWLPALAKRRIALLVTDSRRKDGAFVICWIRDAAGVEPREPISAPLREERQARRAQ